ncbi:MAG TPA: hypothetical protein VE987_08955 [Polyangiaceae bacterium]|nr:hypothetical protein [Polyangiaceae bacterium]
MAPRSFSAGAVLERPRPAVTFPVVSALVDARDPGLPERARGARESAAAGAAPDAVGELPVIARIERPRRLAPATLLCAWSAAASRFASVASDRRVVRMAMPVALWSLVAAAALAVPAFTRPASSGGAGGAREAGQAAQGGQGWVLVTRADRSRYPRAVCSERVLARGAAVARAEGRLKAAQFAHSSHPIPMRR